ncbi:lactose permease [Colletotrichum orchidophilum]|uniref:Lactose permease n=1 Tax=Colletotrichum orchidophilum TaxID=1209926 RepID=A0A1G4BA85_9PEZI|nr:lactose permease [Colletotrichum orchidophilum]OHE98303.1 lactose permease [Colletotrichum orchidophilum]
MGFLKSKPAKKMAVQAVGSDLLAMLASTPVPFIARASTTGDASGDASSPLVDYEVKEIQENVRLENEPVPKPSYLELVRIAHNRHRTLIAAIRGLGAQLKTLRIGRCKVVDQTQVEEHLRRRERAALCNRHSRFISIPQILLHYWPTQICRATPHDGWTFIRIPATKFALPVLLLSVTFARDESQPIGKF